MSHTRICSKHFASDCFVKSPWSSKRVLKANAIPNVSNVHETHNERHIQEMDVLNIPCIETENETAKYNSFHDQYLNLVYNCLQ